MKIPQERGVYKYMRIYLYTALSISFLNEGINRFWRGVTTGRSAGKPDFAGASDFAIATEDRSYAGQDVGQARKGKKVIP